MASKKHPCGYFFPSHKWTKWSKAAKRGQNKGTQQRHCRKCGELQVRQAKAGFHFHRWRLNRRNHMLECRVIGCSATRQGRERR